MKLAEHTENIRKLIDKAFRNRLGRLGVTASGGQSIDKVPAEYHEDRRRMESIIDVFTDETGSKADAFEKLIEECTFTLFNRIAALKVMEAHTLHAEIITRRTQHGDRSFSHFLWLEQNPHGRILELEGLVQFLLDQFKNLSGEIHLFSQEYLFHLLPTAIELNGIINAFNQVETDSQVEHDIWKSDDVLGWLYESYNNYKKAAHKESGDKTEYNKVSIQSQWYTPRWVVKFLVDNSLGKLYLEMYPDSKIKDKYKIANAPKTQVRERKPLTEIRLIDLANGSANFLLYGFDLFYDLYIDQIENYSADYDETEISELIMRHNLHGIDIDDRAVQLAHLGLYIKVKRRNRSARISHFNIVSSDFFLPEYEKVKHLFVNGENLNPELEKIVIELWADLQQAYKFGSLLKLEEKFNSRLHALAQEHNRPQMTLFGKEELTNYDKFRLTFFDNLEKAVKHNAEKQGHSFLNTKTGDAITFLRLMTQKYDVSVANPPYTDSADFGPDLKRFIDGNYKRPWKFNTNLYAAFINKCCEIIDNKGKMAIVHPPTFMYIKTFEDVRKFIVEIMHISIFVEWGYLGMFNTSARVDSAMYVLEKEKIHGPGQFIKLNDLYEGKRYDALFAAYDSLLNNRPNKHNYTLDQSKLKIIEGWPFIYWISDGFREKFKGLTLDNIADIRAGIQTSNNNRFLRLWWEVGTENIILKQNLDRSIKRWALYSKGGPYNKWYGNLWSVIDWKDDGSYLQSYLHSCGQDLHAQEYYFKEGITYSASGSKGVSFRQLPNKCLFDIGGSSIFITKDITSANYLIGLLNSKISFYIADCLNPTVNVQPQDLKRIPFARPGKQQEDTIISLSLKNIEIKRTLCLFHIIEINYDKNPFITFFAATLKDRLLAYLNYENAQLTQVLINEAIINELIFKVYELSSEDRLQVETKMGKPAGELPALVEAKDAYLSSVEIENKTVKQFIKDLKVVSFDETKIQEIKDDFATLYQNNNDLEEFCIRHQVSPISVWYWFKEAKVLPQSRVTEITLEFLTDAIRTILANDDDGIIPLVGLPGEPRLLDRLEKHCMDNGFTVAQFMQLDGLLSRPLGDYLENNFFKDLSDHLNLFMYLPKTPFIWHLSSGAHQGFEAYIIIYKWNRDSLFKLKSQYLSKRTEKLEYRQIELANSSSAQAQSEKETIRFQLQEIADFSKKIDQLITEGYDPKLDDGVGKNIAPLQKKGMLRCEVLNKKQLDKYLNADW